MKKIVLVALMLAVVSGCANTLWFNPDVTPKQAKEDYTDCQIYATQEATKFGWDYGGYSHPLRIPSYRRYIDMTDYYYYFRTCMSNKGYKIVKQ